MMNTITVGTCSICGGPVTVPMVWHGIIPATKQCQKCGAVAAESYGPVIPMVPLVPHRYEYPPTFGPIGPATCSTKTAAEDKS